MSPESAHRTDVFRWAEAGPQQSYRVQILNPLTVGDIALAAGYDLQRMRIDQIYTLKARLRDLASMPWWAPIGGLVGAVQVYAGLTLVNRVGAGLFVGFTVTAALIMSLAIDHFGWLRMDHHPLNVWRALGGLLLIGGVTLVARF
ncbi:MAG: bacterial/archaeal transporter family-2 protein [Acidobacteriaceae bacterium]|nr:bacterial/archaeal transporter family-2 protein [Acidobacteriaceae bacterium]